MRLSRAGFALIEVMLGLTIASFALTVLFSLLHHLILITRKSSEQGERTVIEYVSYPYYVFGQPKEADIAPNKITLESLGSNSVAKEYKKFLKKVVAGKDVLQLVFVPPKPDKKSENKS